MLIEELKYIDKSDKAVRKTGLSVGIVLLLVSLILWWTGKAIFIFFLAGGALLLIFTFTAVRVLRPFHKWWMTFALVMGFFMSRVILTLLFYLIVTPVGLIAKIFSKKFMHLSFDKTATTYWEKRDNPDKEKIDYERQF